MKPETPLETKPLRTRAARLAKSLANGVVVLPTAPERSRNADSHYDYRWDSGFYYLTGFREPEAVLVMVLGEKSRSILFCREKNLEREIWDGFRYGPALARDSFGFDEAHAYSELDTRMPELLADREIVHTPVGSDPAWDLRVAGWINALRPTVRGAERRRMRASQICLRHHAHVSGRRALLRGAARCLRAGPGRPGSRHQGGAPGGRFHRLSRRRHARPGAGPDRLQALQGQRREGSRGRLVQAVLHASHRPLAGARRARPRRPHADGQGAQLEGRHGPHGGAGRPHPPRGKRAQGLLEHRRAHPGRRARDREGPRGA